MLNPNFNNNSKKNKFKKKIKNKKKQIFLYKRRQVNINIHINKPNPFFKESYSSTKAAFFINSFICILMTCVFFQIQIQEFDEALTEEFWGTIHYIRVQPMLKKQGLNADEVSIFKKIKCFILIPLLQFFMKFLLFFIHLHKSAPNEYYLKIWCPVLVADLLIDWKKTILMKYGINIPWLFVVWIFSLMVFFVWSFIFQSSVRYHFSKIRKHSIILTIFTSTFSSITEDIKLINTLNKILEKNKKNFFFKRPFIILKKELIQIRMYIFIYFFIWFKYFFHITIKKFLKKKFYFMIHCNNLEKFKKNAYRFDIKKIKKKNRRYSKNWIILLKIIAIINIFSFLFY